MHRGYGFCPAVPAISRLNGRGEHAKSNRLGDEPADVQGAGAERIFEQAELPVRRLVQVRPE